MSGFEQTPPTLMNATMPELLAWSDSMSLGHPRLDDEHQRLAALIAQFQKALDDDLQAALKAVLDEATAHFAVENDLMTATGFPPRECHIKEHEAVLGTLRGVAERLARGEHTVARRLSAEVAAWFPAHVQHLDSALSHWLCKLQHGGKPVVLHTGGDKGRERQRRHDVVPAGA